MSPFRTPEAFSVALHCPEFPQYENLDAGEILKSAHAEMIVVVDESGVAEYEYQFSLPPYPERGEKPVSRSAASESNPGSHRHACPRVALSMLPSTFGIERQKASSYPVQIRQT